MSAVQQIRRWLLAVALCAAVAVVVGAGCTVGDDADCQSDADCADGEVCIDGGGVFVRDGVCVDPDSDHPPQCDDGRQSGQQTDVDCGGPLCATCPLDAGCEDDDDCATEFCHQGSCLNLCLREETRCDGDCFDTDSNPDHCGECDRACGDDETCEDGQCVCRHECCGDDDCAEHAFCDVVTCRPLAPFVYTGSEDHTVRKIDAAGDEVWNYGGHTGPILDIAVGADGYVYTASGDREVHKLGPDGERQWSVDDHSDAVQGVAVDADGNVVSASSDESVLSVDAAGDFRWQYGELEQPLFGAEVDADGFAYIHDGDGNVHKVAPDADGSSTFSIGDEVFDLSVDAQGLMYVGLDAEAQGLRADGVPRWQYSDFSQPVLAVAVGFGGEVYAAGYTELAGLDDNGDELWSVDVPDIVLDIAVDTHGDIYLGGIDDHLRQYGPDGEPGWVFSGHDEPVTAVAVDPGTPAVFGEDES